MGYYSEIIDYFPEFKENPEYMTLKNICDVYTAPKTQTLQISLYLTFKKKEI